MRKTYCEHCHSETIDIRCTCSLQGIRYQDLRCFSQEIGARWDSLWVKQLVNVEEHVSVDEGSPVCAYKYFSRSDRAVHSACRVVEG